MIIPPAVASELLNPASRLESINPASLPVTVQATKRNDLCSLFQSQHRLDRGESEALALALELNAEEVIIDERLGREVAVLHGLRPIGLLGTLRRAKQRRLVERIRPLIDELQAVNFRIAPALRAQVLARAGE